MDILIVDPSATRRRMIRGPLERTVGAVYEEASTGRSAINLLDTRREVVVLTGPELGGMTAPTFAGLLRRLPGHVLTPLLLVTPPVSHDEFLDAIDAGYHDCLLVPFEDPLLVGKVERAIADLKRRLQAAAQPGTQPAARPARYKHMGLLQPNHPGPD